MIGLVGSILLIYVSSQPSAIVIGAAFSALSFYVSVLGVRDLFAGTGISALDYIVRSFLGELREPQVVEAPRTGVQEQTVYMYGPRNLVVKPDAAVVLIRGSRLTRVQGPGTVVTQPFEYVERIYNLRPIHKSYRFREVLTRDSTPMEVEVSITYGIRVGIGARLGEVELTQQERAALRQLTAWAPDWEAALRDIIEKNLRRAIGTLSLRQVLEVSNQLRAQTETVAVSRADVGRWGLGIYELHIVAVQPNAMVVNASLDNWLVRLTNQTLLRKELGRGTAWARAINAIATAYREAQGQGLPDTVIYRELVRRLFEQAAMDPTAKNLLQSELSQMISRRDVDQLPPAP
jgi:regulator of protease activity HflC (stomatin/prohibitin superfamily)